MNSPLFYILATVVTIIILYIIVSLAYVRKRKKTFFDMQDNLRIGSKVLVANSIYGTVREVKKDCVKVEISDNVIISADRATVFCPPVGTP